MEGAPPPPSLHKRTVGAASGAMGAEDAEGIARRILDASARLLSTRGYEATTTRAIAKDVGLKPGSIYHHFPSKDVIVETVVIEGIHVVHDAVISALAALPNNSGAYERIETAIRAHLLSSLEHSEYTSASIRAFAFLPDYIRQRCRSERRKYEDIWRMLMKEASEAHLIAPDVSRDAVRLLLLGALNWASEWYRPNGLPIDKIAHDFAASVLHIGRPSEPGIGREQ